MARKWVGPVYRRVAVTEVQDTRVRKLTDLAFRVWVDARIGRQSARLGFGPFSIALAAEDLAREANEVRAAFEQVCSTMGWKFDAEARWLLIPEALAVSWDGSPAQLIGYRREIARQSPPTWLLEQFDGIAENLGATTAQSSRPTTGGGPADLRVDHRATTGGTVLALVHEHEHGEGRRPEPIVRRRRLDAAFEGPRVYVPNRLHADFLALLNHPAAEAELLTWYGVVSDEWTTGIHRNDNPGADMFRFWKPLFDAKWSPTAIKPVHAAGPAVPGIEETRRAMQQRLAGGTA